MKFIFKVLTLLLLCFHGSVQAQNSAFEEAKDKGYALYVEKDYSGALYHYERALELAKENFIVSDKRVEQAYFNMAILHYLNGEYEKAESYYQQSILHLEAFHQTDTTLMVGRMTEYLNQCLKRGDKKAEMQAREKLLQYSPVLTDKLFQMNELAVLEYKQNNAKRAVELYQTWIPYYLVLEDSIRLKQGFKYYFSNAGYILNELKQYDSAIHYYALGAANWKALGLDTSREYLSGLESLRDIYTFNRRYSENVALLQDIISCYKLQGRETEQACLTNHLKLMEQSRLAKDPNALEYIDQAIDAYAEAGDPLQPDVVSYHRGYTLYFLNRFQESVDTLFPLVEKRSAEGYTDSFFYFTVGKIMSFALFSLDEHQTVVDNMQLVYDFYKDKEKYLADQDDALHFLVLSNRSLEAYDLSINYLKLQLEVKAKRFGKNSSSYLNLVDDLIIELYKHDRCAEVDPYMKEFMELGPLVYTPSALSEANIFLFALRFSSNCELTERIDECMSKLENVESAELPRDKRAELFMTLAEVYADKKQFEKAKQLLLKIEEDVKGGPDELSFYRELASVLSELSEYSLAASYTSKAMTHYADDGDTASMVYFEMHADLVDHLKDAGQFQGALEESRQLKKAMEKQDASYSKVYLHLLQDMVFIYSNLSQYDSAADHLIQAYHYAEMSQVDFNFSEASGNLMYSLQLSYLDFQRILIEDELGDGYFVDVLEKEYGDFDRATYIRVQHLGHTGRSKLEENIDLLSFAYQDRLNGRLTRSLENYTKFYDIALKELQDTSPILSSLEMAIGAIYVELERYKEAEQFLTKAYHSIELDEKDRLKKRVLVSLSLSELHMRVGRFLQAIMVQQPVMDHMTEEDVELINLAQLNMANFYFYIKDFKQASKYYRGLTRYKEVSPAIRGKAYYQLGMMNLMQGSTYTYAKVPEHMLAMEYLASQKFEKAAEQLLKTYSKDYPLVSLAKFRIALYKYKQGEDVVDMLEKHLSNIEERLGENHPEVAGLYRELAYVNLKYSEDIALAESQMSYVNKVMLHQIDQVFQISTEYQREALMKKLQEDIDRISQFYDYALTIDSVDVGEAVNYSLSFKSMLLNSKAEMLNALAESKNKRIKKNLENYRTKASTLSSVRHDLSKSKNSIDAMIEEVDSLEKLLVDAYYSKYDYHLEADWRSIKEQLNEGEVAIEFMRYNYLNRSKYPDSIKIGAFIISPDKERAVWVELGKEEQITDFIASTGVDALYASRGISVSSEEEVVYDLQAISSFILDPLKPYLDDVKVIHYSGVGALNLIPFAALEYEKGKVMCNAFQLHRYLHLSAIDKTSATMPLNSITTVGGVQFDPELKPEEQQIIDSLKDRTNSSWSYLPGTLAEVEAISSICSSSDLSSLTGRNATEEALKGYSADQSQVLHIATHGFYKEQESIQDKEMLDVSSFWNDPLSKTGIVLAGGNIAWKKGKNPLRSEDGILYANEIAHMDLQKTDLVVLSACETGLGKVKGSEGIYGLQRAFKMAGVEHMMVSLWQVPDKETAEFMQMFYTQWVDGGDMHQAFIQTQRAMQEKYADQPLKWAGFVLLS